MRFQRRAVGHGNVEGRHAADAGFEFVEAGLGDARGNLGADAVAKSTPDGYTLLVATVSTHAINPGLYSRMPYDPIRDFAVPPDGCLDIVLGGTRPPKHS